MKNKIRILFLSANPWTTSRILVDEEEREIFERLQEGPYRDKFEFHRHAAIRPIDLQRLLMTYEPHIVHFSVHGSKQHKMILGGKPGKGKQVDRDGLVQMFALYKSHVRLVVLNACFTRTQALSLSEVIDYTVGAERGIGDKEGVAFAGAFYRALGFGKSVKAAFESAIAELAIVRMPRTRGLGLFVRNGVNKKDSFPRTNSHLSVKSSGPRRSISALFTNHSGNYGALRGERAWKQEKGEKARTKSPVIRTSSTRASSPSYKQACQNCDHGRGQVSSMQTETNVPALNHTQPGQKLSRSTSASLRRVKRAKRANTDPLVDEVERRASVSYTRAYVTLTIKVFKVALSDSRRTSQTRVGRKDEAVCARASLASKRLERGKRRE
jgi:hypothetical protein